MAIYGDINKNKMEKSELTTRQQVIEDLITKRQRLSYSTLKNFTSPINLVNYLVKKREKTEVEQEGMTFGKICHLLLLEPHKVETDYLFTDKSPTSENQINFANGLITEIKKGNTITEEVAKTIFSQHYKGGSFQNTFDGLIDYSRAIASGKNVLTTSVYNEAKEITDALKHHQEVEDLFSEVSDIEKKLEWEDSGWKFVAYLDMVTALGNIFDLKYTKDSDPSRFERDIQYLKYYMQGGVYAFAMMQNGYTLPDFSILAFDKTFNYQVYNLDYSYINYGIREYKYRLQELDRAIKYKQFYKSYGFFKEKRTVSKPNYLEGFPLEIDLPNMFTAKK